MQLVSKLLASLTACLTLSSVGAQTSLVAHYRLDETSGTVCNDSSGRGNHGTYMGAVTLNRPGARPGSATSVDFDGASGRVEIPGSASLDALRDDLSVAAWIELDVIQLQRVFANRRPNGSGSGGSWAYGLIPTGLRFTTLGVQDYNHNVVLSTATWYHFAVTFDAAFQATFYLDGVAIGLVGGTQTSNPPSSSNQYLIGVLDLGVGPAEWFNGRIDDLQIYSGTLTPADVQYLFANPGAPLGGGMLGTAYCSPAAVNSTGQSATTRASGSTSVAANNLTLVAARLPQSSFGFFLTSRTQGFVQNPGGSSGHLCLSGAIGRYVGPGQIKNSGTQGSFSLLVNLAQTPSPAGFVQVLAGQTWNFQSWYRDAVGGVATSNFTDGLSILFQ